MGTSTIHTLRRLAILLGIFAFILSAGAGQSAWRAAAAAASAALSGGLPMVDAGWSHSCGVTAGGEVECWGWNDYAQSDHPAGAFIQVGGGVHYSCGLKSDGKATCWGYDSSGEASPPDIAFTQIAVGQYHSCGLKSDGSVQCWGTNWYGERNPPAAAFSQISAGSATTCGVKISDQSVVCWGWNNYGQVSGAPSGTFTQVTNGESHNCAIRTDGTLACWGRNVFNAATPPAGTFTQIDAGLYVSCGVRTDGTLDCWGYQTDTYLGPQPGTFTSVSVGGGHACALHSDGTMVCWGANDFGEAPKISFQTGRFLSDGAQGQPYSQSLAASGGTASHTFKVVSGSLPDGLTLSSAGLLSGAPAQGGVFNFEVRVQDAFAIPLAADKLFTLAVNFAPVMEAIGPQTVSEGETLSFIAAAQDEDAGQTRTFSLETGGLIGPAIGATSGVFTWTTSEAQGPGVYPITVTVIDNGSPAAQDSETVVVTVNEINAAPLLAAIGPQNITLGETVSFTAEAADSDLPANALTFLLTGAPDGAAINPDTGAFTWTPAAPGIYTFTVLVNDDGDPLQSDSETITVTVTGHTWLPLLSHP